MISKCVLIFVILLQSAVINRSADAAADGFQLVPGIEIVPVNASDDGAAAGARSSGATVGYIDRVFDYLQAHELKINLHDLMRKTEFSAALSRTFKEIDADNEIGGIDIFLWTDYDLGDLLLFILRSFVIR